MSDDLPTQAQRERGPTDGLPLLLCDGDTSFKFELGGFAQDRLTGYAGKLVARTQYLCGPTTWGLMSMRNLRSDLGGQELATPQNYDWLPEERLEPLSPERAAVAGERQAAAQEQKEQEFYARRQRGAYSTSDKNR